MAKIILTKGGKILKEIPLVKERTNIGRRPHNDVVIEDVIISADHAAINMSFGEPVLEDLNSTNGTLVNGQPIKKHFLRNQDVIELAEYRFQFLVEPYTHDEHLDLASESIINEISLDLLRNHTYPKMWGATETLGIKRRSVSAIKLLNGASAGKEINLAKPLTTLGKLGMQVVVITEYAQEYWLSHVEGEVYPMINGCSIGTDTYCMSHGDVIDLVGMKIKFLDYKNLISIYPSKGI